MTSTYSDLYTLVGPGSGPITLTANLSVQGTIDYDPDVNGWILATGFMNSGASYFSAPASLLASGGPGVAGGPYSRLLELELTLAPGDTTALAFQIDLIANHVGAKLDFSNTVTLGFPDLPDGYFIESATGFDGVGSRAVGGGTAPEPGTLLLGLLAGAAALRAGRPGRRALRR